MVDHMTFSVETTNAGTWISTFVIQTSLVTSAIVVNRALGPTTGVWITKVFR